MTKPDLTSFLRQVHAGRDGGSVVVATMTPAFLWPTISDSDHDLCFVAPMGAAGPLGLGLALARPDLRVLVIDGDGSVLMNLGAFVTIGDQAPPNLTHLIVANGGYAITGGQPLPGRGAGQLRDLARAAGYRKVIELADPNHLDEIDHKHLWRTNGPVFATAEVETVYDRSTLPEMVGLPQARASQGAQGYHRLRSLLAEAQPPTSPKSA